MNERRARLAEINARSLTRGHRIRNRAAHHRAMACLKAQLGDRRPEGMALSLVNYDSASAYDGYNYSRGKRVPYRLSTDPADYAWESTTANLARRDERMKRLRRNDDMTDKQRAAQALRDAGFSVREIADRFVYTGTREERRT